VPLWLYVRGPTADRDTVPDIVGSLDLLNGLFFLMRRHWASTGRSGVLQLARGQPQGEVKFSDGSVTAAEIRGLPRRFPRLHHCLLWTGAENPAQAAARSAARPVSAKGAEIARATGRSPWRA